MIIMMTYKCRTNNRMWNNLKNGLALSLLPTVLYAHMVQDDANQLIKFTKPYHRIISLAPDITEILFAIGAGSSVVGVISGTDYPESSKHIPTVGNYAGIDIELILSLKPDLILTWDILFLRPLKTLQKLGIPIYRINSRQLEDIAHTMNNLGRLTGQDAKAQQVATEWVQQLMQLRKQYQQKRPVRVFYRIGAYSLITINQTSWINQAIVLCGGQNLFAQAIPAAPQITWEALVKANPQVIVTDAKWEPQGQWNNLSAIQHHLLFYIPPDWIDRAGPRLIHGVSALCLALEKTRHSVDG